MGIKKLLTVAALLAAGGLTHSAWAQTDVTSTYLTNPGFDDESSWVATNAAVTSGGNIQEVAGWTKNSSSWAGSATIGYGTSGQCNGSNVPGTNPDGVAEGGALAFSGSWSGTVQYTQAVTLPAGIYTISYDAYNAQTSTDVNNKIATNMIGFIADTGTQFLGTKTTFTTQSWVNETFTFVLTASTPGKISVGAKYPEASSNVTARLFIDGITITYKAFDEVTESSPVDFTSMATNVWTNGGNTYTAGGVVMRERYFDDQHRTGDMLTQTISGLPAGIYTVELYANANFTSGRGLDAVAEAGAEVSSVFANTVTVKVPLAHQTSTAAAGEYTLSNVKVTDGTLTLGLRNDSEGANWNLIAVKSIKYLGADLEVAKTSLNTAIGKAEDIDQSKLNTGVKTLLTDALSTANTAYNSGTLKEIIDADNNLNSVITIANNIQEPYAKLSAYKAIATNSEETEAGAKETYNGVISANEATIEAATTVSEIETVLSVIETARQAYIVKAVPTNGTTFDYTFFVKNATFNGSSDGWIIGGKKTNNGDYRLNTVQGKTCWNSWNNKFESMDIHQDITNLPDGKYKVTCKAITEVNRITDQHAYAQTTSGKVVSPNMTIANFTSPEGWESLETAEAIVIDGKLTIGFESTSTGEQNGWFCVTDFELAYVSAVSDSEYATIAKENLLAIINTANGLNTTINVGTGVFQIPTSAVNTITSAISDAQEVYNNDEATKSAVEEACIALESAIEAYENVELNAPAENTRYNVVLNFEGWDYDNKAITFIAGGRNDAGLYNIQYLVDPNPNYAQAIIFTKAEGANRYTMSIMDVDGNQRYICTGVPYSGNTSQIRTTTDASKALVVEIRVTNVEGNLNIFNTEANNYIGSQDNGVYTVNSHIDFNIVEAVEAEVTLNISAGKYATRIFPFAAEIPAGVTVYSCATIEGQTLILSEEDAIAPNVPYILYSEEGVETTLTGYGTAKQDTYEAGLLTGVYGTGTVPAGSYVLQTQEGVQGFYKVAETAVDYVSYRAYLTVPSANAKAFFFGGDATAINGVEGAEGATEVVRFNAAGVQVAAPVKGLNIVKMSDGTVKKVMVK